MIGTLILDKVVCNLTTKSQVGNWRYMENQQQNLLVVYFSTKYDYLYGHVTDFQQ